MKCFEVQLKSWCKSDSSYFRYGKHQYRCTDEGKVYCVANNAVDVYLYFGEQFIKSVTELGPVIPPSLAIVNLSQDMPSEKEAEG